MTPIRGPLARLDRSRDELAKAWLVRLIERASLEEISELPTEQIARELPQLISDIVGSVASANGDPYQLSDEQAQRAASLAALRSGRETNVGDVARDIAALQAVLVRALRDELAESEPERFADAVERLADATGAIQAAAVEELVRSRSRELESQANTDPLTGLGNLRHLQRELAHMLEIQKRYGHPFGVLLMDIDGLKRINDSQGHQAGDRLLMQVAMALRRSIRNVDVAARLGGDEFCVLAPEQGAEAATLLAERLSTAVTEEISIPADPPVGLSIGVVSCPEHGDEAESLIDGADRAMYRAKAAGDNVALGEPPPAEVAEETNNGTPG
ncbi:MAG: two-component system, sensor histidine kinase LadS [Thermoleophilaceae bacterium]|jgi:diguanylate cyclase (GGDEF)-like protein|nr:two-component system, sensor histidine kinase LadS [Thermoleophilaceae bacterium]